MTSNNGIGNKIKKAANPQELDKFLAQDSFTIKEELDIWAKFGMLTGSGDYFIYRNKNRATISSRGINYHYVVHQVMNKDSNILYKKIIGDEPEIIWNHPGNLWKDNLYWNAEKGEWLDRSTLPALPIYTKEEDAISIIESVVMSVVKSAKKNSQPLVLTKQDFCYTCVGSDNVWYAFYPSNEKLIAYAEKFNKSEFIEFLRSEEFTTLRNLWD